MAFTSSAFVPRPATRHRTIATTHFFVIISFPFRSHAILAHVDDTARLDLFAAIKTSRFLYNTPDNPQQLQKSADSGICRSSILIRRVLRQASQCATDSQAIMTRLRNEPHRYSPITPVSRITR